MRKYMKYCITHAFFFSKCLKSMRALQCIIFCKLRVPSPL